MKQKSINVLLALGLLLILLVSACTAPTTSTSTTGTGAQTQTGTASQGRVVLTVTDAAANMGSVSSVEVTINKVMVRGATKGWVDVTSGSKTFDLLKLKAEGSQELLADLKLDEDAYNQVRLDISKVMVTDATGEHEAKLPSGTLRINTDLTVKANSTSAAKFDFIADESLHVTGNGKYIMAPVIQVNTIENTDVEIASDNKVEIKGGKIKTNAKIGMDAEGNVGVGVKIPANAEVSLEGDKVKIGATVKTEVGAGTGAGASVKGNTVFAITDAAKNMSGVTSVKVTVEKVMINSPAQGWVDVATNAQTFDLLKLKEEGSLALITSADLKADFYDQIRLDISKVMVTDATGEHEAKLPSGTLKTYSTLVVNENLNTTSTVVFDFIVDKSLHVTGKGEYVMAPVIKIETKEMANVEVKSGNKIEIKGGNIKSQQEVGMNTEGDVGVGLGIPANAEVSIESGKIKAKTKVVVGV